MDDFFKFQYLKHYDDFTTQLKVIFPDHINILDNILGYSEEIKVSNGLKFYDSITTEYFDSFLKAKVKVLSHKNPETQKISESLFGAEFCLKNLINNQPEEVKKIIWINLHTLYMILELLKPDNQRDQERIKLLNSVIYKERGLGDPSNSQTTDSNFNAPETKKKLQEMLGVDVNQQTSDMINDIVGSFEKILTSNTGNPLTGIMEVSQLISVKYADKITNGEIELDKLMQSISSKVPGMEQMMSGLMKGGKAKPKSEDKVIIDENFSTAQVQVGPKEEESSFNIGSMLKMADQFGVLPGGKSNTESIEGIPNIGKVMELMQKLEKTETPEDAIALKNEMDTFLQAELGINITKLNEQLEQVTNNFNNLNTNTDKQ